MIPESQSWEMGVLRNLRGTYEGRGMRFYINPPPDVVGVSDLLCKRAAGPLIVLSAR